MTSNNACFVGKVKLSKDKKEKDKIKVKKKKRKSDDLVSMMMSKLTRKSFDFNRSTCHQYDYIVNRITSSSKNTDELVDLEKYIDNLRSGPLIHLKVEVNLMLFFEAVKIQRFLYITCISEVNLCTDVF